MRKMENVWASTTISGIIVHSSVFTEHFPSQLFFTTAAELLYVWNAI